VKDSSAPGAFKGVLDGLDGVFHVASPVSFKVKSNVNDLINPAVNGVTELFTEATQVSSISRVVLTASFVCMVNAGAPPPVYNESHFNPITLEQASNGSAVLGYVGSKFFSEKAAFDFVSSKKPHFDIVSLCPVMIYGPIAHQISSFSDLGESAAAFYEIVAGKSEIEYKSYDLCHQYVDVRDVAIAHILAFENPKASNQRYLISKGDYDWQEVADHAHKHFPNKAKAKLGNPGKYHEPNHCVDNSKSRTHLGLTYRPKEETYHDTIKQILDLEAQGMK